MKDLKDMKGIAQDAEADEPRRFIDRIDKTIVALLYERLRLGQRLKQLEDHESGRLENAHERHR